MTDIVALAARARQRRVVVVGGGVAGLVAGVECARLGIQVTVVEASSHLGGAIRSARIAGLDLDVGAESWATRGGTVRALIDDLGLGHAVVAPEPGGAWVAGSFGAAPLPPGGVLGIPANPFDPRVRRVIGWTGAWRAYLDRIRPPLTIGHEPSLGRLVAARMGPRVLDRLVAPVTTGVYSARPDDIDVDLAAPGLNAALTRTGSLSGAVAELRGSGEAPGAAVESLRGAMTRLVDALATRLTELGGDVRTGIAVDAVVAGEERAWRVVTPDDTFDADAVVVAVGESAARRLLAPVVPGLDEHAAAGPVVELVTLVVDAPALDARPRGTGVLTVPAAFTAKALTHATAKWAWLAEAAGPGRHVLRVSFGAQGEAPATAGMSDSDAAVLAVAEASALLGVALRTDQVVGSHRERHEQAQPAATIGRAEQAADARGAVAAVGGLAAVGAWLAGTGLAQVVPDARAEADRLRRTLVWGDGPGETL